MERGHQAVARLYHAWITGLILMVVTRRGAPAAAEFVFRLFRRQHREKFLAGIEKLGLSSLPPAVASAQYHYLSNQIGGVRVEYCRESDRKAWIRYPPPRWIWEGTAICAIPSEVSQAMLRGWHAENGVSLREPRLGFVCTKQTVDGQDALEGYFYQHDRVLRPEERLRFSRGEEMPPFDAGAAPRLPEPAWSAERLDKARRNYAMDYVRSALPELVALFGPAEARFLGGRSAYLIGLQHFHDLKALLGIEREGATGFAEFFRRLAAAQGDEALIVSEDAGITLRQVGWRLMGSGRSDIAFQLWNELWSGCLAAHDRRLRWEVCVDAVASDGAFTWRIA